MSNLSHRDSSARARRTRVNRFAFGLEDLESRTVLSSTATLPVNPVAIAPTQPAVQLQAVTVNNVQATGNQQFVANATLSAKVGAQNVSVPLSIPITATVTQISPSVTSSVSPTVAQPVTVLALQIQPLNLSLLGLNVHLGTNSNPADKTPITVDLVAIPTGASYVSPINGVTYQGGLLGDVLSGVYNLLGSNTFNGLSSLVNNIDTGLSNLLNTLLTQPNSPSSTTPAPSFPVLNLPLGPVSLDLLGALVQTSTIDLNISATPSNGLLGQILAS